MSATAQIVIGTWIVCIVLYEIGLWLDADVDPDLDGSFRGIVFRAWLWLVSPLWVLVGLATLVFGPDRR